jgi:drug/metabolite transporter (DMT)-like permease
MPYVIFAAVCLLWGSSFILMKKAGLALGPISLGGWRVTSGAAVLALIWWRERDRLRIERRHILPMVVAGVVTFAWPYALQPYFIFRHGSAMMGMMVAFVPVLTIVVSMPMLGVYPTRRQIFGVVGGLLCLGLILADGLDRNIPWTSLALATTVPLCYAVGNTYIRLRLPGVSPLPITTISLASAGAILLPLSQFHAQLAKWELDDPQVTIGSHDWWVGIAALGVLGVLGTGLATYLFNKLIVDEGPLFAGMTTYLIPIGAIFWGSIDREPITVRQLAAITGVLVMVALVQYGSARSAT